MRKAGLRAAAAVLALMLALGATYSLADGGEWTCQNCGKTGNSGNFCTNCGAARPIEEWTCQNCGKTGNTGNFCSNCGNAKPSGGQTVNEWLEQISGETNRVKVCLAGVDASGYIVNKKNPDKWLPEHAVDGDESTCWQVSGKKGLKGTVWLQLNTGAEQTVEELWVKNGFWAYNDKGRDQYHINARPKDIRVEFLYAGEMNYRDSVSLKLKDEVFTDWQRFDTGRREHVTSVRIWVWKAAAAMAATAGTPVSARAGTPPRTSASVCTTTTSAPSPATCAIRSPV